MKELWFNSIAELLQKQLINESADFGKNLLSELLQKQLIKNQLNAYELRKTELL